MSVIFFPDRKSDWFGDNHIDERFEFVGNDFVDRIVEYNQPKILECSRCRYFSNNRYEVGIKFRRKISRFKEIINCGRNTCPQNLLIRFKESWLESVGAPTGSFSTEFSKFPIKKGIQLKLDS